MTLQRSTSLLLRGNTRFVSSQGPAGSTQANVRQQQWTQGGQEAQDMLR
jgi:hypothetical protein